MEKRDFFISYTQQDELWALWIADTLTAHGYTVYIQARDIVPGDNFLDKMNEFLKNSGSFIAVWSKAYSESRFCMAELQSAFYAWNKGKMYHLLPVRIDNYSLEPLYAGLVYVDLSDMSAASKKKLLDAVRRNAVPHTLVTTITPVILKAPEQTSDKPIQHYTSTLYQWGENYYYGKYGARNYAMARMYYEQAANAGDADALYSLGFLYTRGKGVKQNYVRAREYYEQAAKKGHAAAMDELGDFYADGKGVKQDYIKAREYYEQAAKKGNGDALFSLGLLYEYGRGVAKDYEKAFDYYSKADVKGSFIKMLKLLFLQILDGIKEMTQDILNR